MVALTDYEKLVEAAVEENVRCDNLRRRVAAQSPKFLNGKDIKLIPVVLIGKNSFDNLQKVEKPFRQDCPMP